MFTRIGRLALAGLAALALCGCPPPATDTSNGGTGGTVATGGKVTGEISIGHFASLTGQTAQFGQGTDNGVKLAAEELNAAGTGLSVKVETLDDASLKEKVVPVVTRLISEYRAHALVGEVASARSIAAAPIANQRQVPMVSPSSTNPDVTVDPRTKETYPYVFRVCFTDPFQGDVIARFVNQNLKHSRAALLTDVKNPYSVGLAEGFKAGFAKLGGTIVAEEAFQESDKEFRSQLTKIQGAQPEVLIMTGYYPEANLIVSQARQLGLKVPVVGGDGWDSPTLGEGVERHFTDCYFSNHFSPEEKRPGVAEFVKAYQAKFSSPPNALAALGYDAVKLVADAVGRAGSLDRKALRDAIEQTKEFNGVTGLITIDPQHNARKSAVVVKVDAQEGRKPKFPVVATIQP